MSYGFKLSSLDWPEASSSVCVSQTDVGQPLRVVPMIFLPLLFIWSRAPMRFSFRIRATVLASFVLGVMSISIDCQLPGITAITIAADSWDSESAKEIDDPRVDSSRPRLREGFRIGSTVGRFSRVGRRWIFEAEPANVTDEDKAALNLGAAGSQQASTEEPVAPAQFRVLENLALQRVVDAVTQDPNDLRWTVTGVLTEYSGENWLLLGTVFRAPSKPEVLATK